MSTDTAVDYQTLALDAWTLTRRIRPLWWLGLVSAVQALMYELIVLALSAPLVVLPQLIVVPRPSSAAADVQLDAVREQAITWLANIVSAHGGAIASGVAVVFALWIAVGVLDVASQTGLITQACAARTGRGASFRVGMRDGFRVWWRVVGLLAIAMLPSLVYLTLMGLVVLFTMTLPLLRGQAPDPGAALAGNAMLAPFSAAMSLVGIPLGVTVQLGMRNAVIADADWRASLSAGWRMLCGSLAEVALVYLLIAGIGIAVAVVLGLALSAIGAIATMAVLALALAGGMGTGTVVVVILGVFLLLSVALVPSMVLLYVWTSCVWTLFWTKKAEVPATVSRGA